MESKLSKQSNASTVQGTNDSSILSKHAMCEAGYASDPFLHAFTLKKAPRRAPLINRGYYIRAKAIEVTLNSFLQDHSGSKQIVSLGAGFDTTYFRLHTNSKTSALMDNVYFVEVDFPEVAERKKILIENDLQCSSLLSQRLESKHNSVRLDSPGYCLVGMDLADITNLKQIFEMETRLDPCVPTLVLSECVMTYMEADLSTALIQFTCQFFTNSIFVTYEQVEPDDAFGLFMQSHFSKLNSSLRCINRYPSKEKQMERYIHCGYRKVDVVSMKELYDWLPTQETDRVRQLEYFDEYEEWSLKCSHYVLIIARGDDGFTTMERMINSIAPYYKNTSISTAMATLSDGHCSTGAEQFGHASSLLPVSGTEALLVTHGGFGVTNGKHCRQSQLRMYSFSFTDNSVKYIGTSDTLTCRLHHTFTPINNSQVFVYGGRLSPANPLGQPAILTISSTQDRKTEVSVDNVVDNGDVPLARWRHAAVCVSIDSVDHIIVTGGLTGSKCTQGSTALSCCYIFNTTTSTWSCLPSYPQPIHSHAMCYDGNRYVYSTGGLCSREQPITDSYRLDTQNLSEGWRRIHLPLQPVFGHSMHLIADTFIVIGGIGCRGQQVYLQTFSLCSEECTHVMLPVKINDSLRMYFSHTSHLWKGSFNNPKIVIAGGGGNCFSFGTHINNMISTYSLNDILTLM